MSASVKMWSQQELWEIVQRGRMALGLSVDDVAREAKLKPATLERFEADGGTRPALRRVKYAIDRLARRATEFQVTEIR